MLLLWLLLITQAAAETGARPRIGLALSGGGALGFAHIGVLRLLDSLDIPIDYIAGTSMGGLAGALYAVGYSGAEIEQIAHSVDWQDLFNDLPKRPYLPYFQKKDAEMYQYEFGLRDFRPVDKGGLIAGQKIALLFARLVLPYLNCTNFDSLPIPFRCVAVDLVTGKEVILGRGSLPLAMRATMAVPSIFSPVAWGDSLLIDGGLLNNLPADVVKAMGADLVIASVVANPYKSRKEIRTSLDVLAQSYNILRDLKLDYNADKADLLIRTELRGLTQVDFINSRIERIIAEGKAAAQNALPELLALKERYNLSRDSKLAHVVPESDKPTIGKITIVGNQIIPTIAIENVLGFQLGEPFIADTLEARLKRLTDLGDYRQVKGQTKALDNGQVEIVVNLIEEQKPLIYGIDIRGNRRLSFNFIYRSFGINPGEIFSLPRIEERINYLYGLGYFKSVTYTLEQIDRNQVRLVLFVDEQPPEKLRVGVRYDTYHQLVAALAYQSTGAWLHGMRLDAEWQFIGLEQFKLRTLYPSRTHAYPFYPFLQFITRQVPAYVYSSKSGNKIARYLDRSLEAGGGLGFLYQNYWNFESALNYEYVNIRPDIAPEDSSLFVNWRDDLWKWRLSSDIDLLDNAFAPRRGMRMHVGWERVFHDKGADSRYTRLEFMGDFYYSVRRHILRFYGYYGQVNMAGFSNRFIYQGGPETFVGMNYDQIAATRLGMVRLDYYYEALKNFYAYSVFNIGLGFANTILEPNFKPSALSGYGVGLKYVSPVGPLNIVLGYGPTSLVKTQPKRLILYFTAGYYF